MADNDDIVNSAQKVASTDGLLAQILLPMPIKSLVRFKSVSKPWLFLISDPYFCSARSRNVGTAAGLFVHRHLFSFVPLNEEAEVFASARDVPFANAISHSCNGLLCYYKLPDFKDYRRKIIYVCNPTTNQHRLIPDPTYRIFNRSSTRQVHLAFDPTKSSHYKVVCVYSSDFVPEDSSDSASEDSEYDVYDPIPQYFEIEIYSSETGLWKHAVGPFAAHIDFKFGVFWNGAVNWSSDTGDSFYFSVDEEHLGIFPMPPLLEGMEFRNIVYFGESKGHLHLIENNSAPATQFSVYEMQKDYSGWFVKYNVDLEVVMHAFPESIFDECHPSELYYFRFGLMRIVRGETDEDAYIAVSIRHKVIRYNITHKTFRKLCDLPFSSYEYDNHSPVIPWKNAFQYIESLACV